MMEESNLPYQRIPEEPIIITEEGLFLDLAQGVVDWIVSPEASSPGPEPHEPSLRIAAIWGGRGSGKTSMLHTILHLLDQQENARLRLPRSESNCHPKHTDRGRLFEPFKVIGGGDRLFIHLLEFFRERYWQGEQGPPFAKTLTYEAQALAPDRFLDYERDVASSESQLIKKTVEFYRGLGSRSIEIQKDIKAEFGKLGQRVVLLIDDLDMQPQHAYELLQVLHTYLHATDVVVILAADHEQLLGTVDHRLREKIDMPGLGAQVLAKYITAEWRLPTPDKRERESELFTPKRKSDPGYRTHTFSSWWDGFRAPLQKPQDEIISERGAADQNSSNEAKIDPRQAMDLFIEASPPTWRGLCRLHNRAIALEQLFKTLEKLSGTYRERVNSSLRNVPAFLAVLLAFDESFPELLIFESFEREGLRVQQALSPSPTGEENNPQWEIPDEEAILFPVRDRLLNAQVIHGQRRGQAESLLRRLGLLWRDIWMKSSEEEGVSHKFLAISVNDDAQARSKDWWTPMVVDGDEVDHIDLRKEVLGGRPTAEEITRLCETLENDHSASLKRDHQQLFAMAPLSLAAWIGWYTRYVQGLKVLAENRQEGRFHIFSPPIGDEFEPGYLIFHKPERIPVPSTNAQVYDAAVLVDVRPNPDRSSSPIPFKTAGGTSVEFSQYLKLASEPNFQLADDQQVADIIHDLRLVLNDLRDNYDIRRIHLGLAVPSALAILIGRELHPWNPVLVYEYTPGSEPGPTYDYVVTLE